MQRMSQDFRDFSKTTVHAAQTQRSSQQIRLAVISRQHIVKRVLCQKEYVAGPPTSPLVSITDCGAANTKGWLPTSAKLSMSVLRPNNGTLSGVSTPSEKFMLAAQAFPSPRTQGNGRTKQQVPSS